MLPPIDGSTGVAPRGGSHSTSGNGRKQGTLVPSRVETMPPAPWLGMPPGGPAAPVSVGLNMRALLHSFRRRSFVALVMGLVTASLVMWVVWMFVPVQSVVEAWFLCKAEQPVLIEAPAAEQSRRNTNEFDVFRRTQMAMIQTPLVLAAAVRPREISELPVIKAEKDPVMYLQNELRVEFSGESELLRISMRGDDPEQLVAIVNSVADAYIREVVENDRNARRRTQETLRSQLEQTEGQLRTSLNELKRLAQTLGMSTEDVLETQQRIGMAQLNDLSRMLWQLRTDRTKAEYAVAVAKFNMDRMQGVTIPDMVIEAQLAKDPEVQQRQMRVMQAEEQVRMSRLRTASDAGDNATPAHVRRKEEELAMMREELANYLAERRPQFEEQMKASTEFVDYEAEYSFAAENLRRIKEELELMQQNYDETKSYLQKLSSSTPDLEALRTRIEQQRVKASKIAIELNKLELELQAPPRVTLVQRASLPESDSMKLKLIITSFAGLLGFGLTVFGISYWEMQAGRISEATDVSQGLGVRIVGALPRIGGRLTRGSAQDGLIEAIDSLRTRLMHDASADGTRIVMVTSAARQEGKTTLASQLAASLARAGRRTVLVDGDFRKPTAHHLFELPLEPGLSEVLRGEIDLDDVIRPTRAAGLWMISAGRCDVESLQELSKGGVGIWFEKLRLDFDFVVVDTGPVLSLADPLLLGQQCDAALLSVLRDVSQASRVQEAYERLESVGTHVLGTVVQGVKKPSNERAVALPARV